MIFNVMAGVVVVLLLGAGGVWFREEVREKCNAQWELALEKERRVLDEKVDVANAKIRESHEAAQKKIEDKDVQLMEKEQELEVQRGKIPLSEACVVCRVDASRIGVR